MIKSLQDVLKNWNIIMFGEEQENQHILTEKFNQNKIYMYINLCKFYEKLGDIAKSHAVLESYGDYIVDTYNER